MFSGLDINILVILGVHARQQRKRRLNALTGWLSGKLHWKCTVEWSLVKNYDFCFLKFLNGLAISFISMKKKILGRICI